MLVLSRKPNESIIIGDEIEVKIVEVKGDYVKLGITAPKHIPVHRKEIYDAIQRENIEAVRSNVTDLDQLGDMLSFEPQDPKKGLDSKDTPADKNTDANGKKEQSNDT